MEFWRKASCPSWFGAVIVLTVTLIAFLASAVVKSEGCKLVLGRIFVIDIQNNSVRLLIDLPAKTTVASNISISNN